MLKVFLTHTPHALENYYGARALEALRKIVDVQINETGRVMDTQDLIGQTPGNDILVVDRNTPLDVNFFENCTGVMAVHRGAVDHRNVDVEAASKNGILVTNANPGFVDSVTELIIGMMIDLGRSVSSYVVQFHAENPPIPHLGHQLAGSTLGIIGYGSIGKRLSEVAAVLGMKILVHDPYITITDEHIHQVSFLDVLAGADFLACLAVATDETENLMNEAAFSAMKQSSYFINVSRGNLVDEAALEVALNIGHLAGAALDVGRAPDQMPTPSLAAHPNVIATPHIGGQTPQSAEFQALETVEQVRALTEGEMPHNALNPEEARLVRAYLQEFTRSS